MARRTLYCRHCGVVIRRCWCVAHLPPMYQHWPALFHRCGRDGDAVTFAEPDPLEDA
jgi:hypothetical protein